jgi:hypothetical protein
MREDVDFTIADEAWKIGFWNEDVFDFLALVSGLAPSWGNGISLIEIDEAIRSSRI